MYVYICDRATDDQMNTNASNGPYGTRIRIYTAKILFIYLRRMGHTVLRCERTILHIHLILRDSLRYFQIQKTSNGFKQLVYMVFVRDHKCRCLFAYNHIMQWQIQISTIGLPDDPLYFKLVL